LTSREQDAPSLFSIRVTRYSTKVLNVQNYDVVLKKFGNFAKTKEYQMSLNPYTQV